MWGPTVVKRIRQWAAGDSLLLEVQYALQRRCLNLVFLQFKRFSCRLYELSLEDECKLWSDDASVPSRSRQSISHELHNVHINGYAL